MTSWPAFQSFVPNIPTIIEIFSGKSQNKGNAIAFILQNQNKSPVKILTDIRCSEL